MDFEVHSAIWGYVLGWFMAICMILTSKDPKGGDDAND